MRKLMATAIVVLMAGAGSSYALFGLEDISYDGSLEFSGNSANNETDFSPSNDRRGGTQTRLRVGINAMITEGVNGRVELTRNGASSGRRFGNGATSVAGEEGSLLFNNAYVDFVELWGLNTVRLGRQYVGRAGDLVWNFSPTDDDALTVRAIDGILIGKSCSNDMLHLSVFTGKALDGDGVRGSGTEADNNDLVTTGDIDLSNIELNVTNVIPEGNIRAGFAHGIDDNATTQADNNKLRIYRVGVDGGVNENFITYRAEYFMNDGSLNTGASTDVSYEGSAIDLGAGVNFKETGAGNLGLALNILLGSGDDNGADMDDESFHDFSALGVTSSDRLLGEIFGKSNTLVDGGIPGTKSPVGQGIDTGFQGQGLQVLHIGGYYNPNWWEKGTLRVDYYDFTAAEDGPTANTTADDYGSEIDITLSIVETENLNFDFGYATFSPGEILTGVNAPQDDNVEKWFARANISWGGEE